jgi:hypothetical protein
LAIGERMSKGSARRKEDIQKVRDNWDAIFSIKKDPKTLAEHVWNDKMKDMQSDIEKKLIEGEKK